MLLLSRSLPVGGQAVIEGVLMKGPTKWGLCVRKPDGTLHNESWPSWDMASGHLYKIPFIRGLFIMFDMLKTGIRALNRSAEIALGDEETFGLMEIVTSVLLALLAVVGLFLFLPVWISDLTSEFFSLKGIYRDVIEGFARAGIFAGYVGLIGLWKEIGTVFEYHGAEHKTINAYENEAVLSPEVISGYSRIHSRCGTSFLLVVVFVSIVVFSFIGDGSIMWRVISRFILLPLVIGISYEIIRFCSRSGIFGKIIMMPALSLQYLTTREPDLSQIEVAVSSLALALEEE
ncbi:MAG: DUF1385 domain-containing protein [Synergistales bacterium]|nr:DUF1385 domain-containing protein [Synergistales bacterium]